MVGVSEEGEEAVGDVAEHGVLLGEGWGHDDLVEAGLVERRDAVGEVVRGSDEARGGDEVGGDEALLLGQHPAVVTLMQPLVAAVPA